MKITSLFNLSSASSRYGSAFSSSSSSSPSSSTSSYNNSILLKTLAFLLIMACMIDRSFATEYEHGYGGHGGGGGGGHGYEDHYKHQPHPYKFGYKIDDGYGSENTRHESGDGYGNVHGSYTIHDKDGRKRTVEYVADKKGFRAKIHSNEPGLTSHNAAHAYYDVENHGYGDGGHGGYEGGHYGKHDGYKPEEKSHGYHHEQSYA